MAKKDPLLDCAMAAAEIGVTTQQLCLWRLDHIGPKFHRIGNEIYYKLAEIKKFVQTRKNISLKTRGAL